MQIAIDGPTASGKSSVARLLAAHYGWYYISTGLFYRAVGYLLIRDFHYTEDQLHHPSIEDVQRCIAGISYTMREGKGVVVFKGEDITSELKSKEVDHASSLVAAHAPVRHALLVLVRSLVKDTSVVIEGRDIGSVVIPHADIKFYITASVDERARRWQKDQSERGKQYSFQDACQAIQERDYRDEHRPHSPLVITEGSHVIDNTHLNKEETLQRMVEIINAHRNVSKI